MFMMNGGGPWHYGQGAFSMQQRPLANRLGDMQELNGYFGRDRGGLARFDEFDEPVGNSLLPKGVPLLE